MILVFGRSGQVARALAAELAAGTGADTAFAPGQAAFLDRGAADLAEPGACAAAIRARRPAAVINAAAWTDVDGAEAEEARATRINAAAPAAMARAAAGLGIPFLHLSSDYVFDGAPGRPRAETDAAAPLNAYGRSKLAGEAAVRAAGGPHAILRTSWVFSASGRNFVTTMLRLAETCDRLRVVEDQRGGPTPAAAIAGALLHIARRMAAGHPGGTYHYAGAPAVSWAGFAREIFARAGRPVTVEGIASAAWPTPAARPRNAVLDCAAIGRDFGLAAPDWRAGLDAVLAELGAAAPEAAR